MGNMNFGDVHPDHSRPPEAGPSSLQEYLRIVAWEDPVVEATGMDPRSSYVETFWLPVLGPSATWLVRHLADGLDAVPDGFDLCLEDEARRLGLGGLGSRHSPFQRAILRCARYGLARHTGPGTLAVRRRISPVPRRHVLRFPDSLRAEHDHWEAERSQRQPAIQAIGRSPAGTPSQRAKDSITDTRVRTPNPVPPLVTYPDPSAARAGPAMSR